MMKKLIALVVMIMLGLTLFGCGSSTNTTGEKQQPEQKEAVKEVTPKQPEEQPNEVPENDPKKAGAPLPLNKKIEVRVEGEKEMREAKLAESKELGYQLYVLKGFSLESEEPGKDVLISEFDGEFFARIEKLSEQTNLVEYKTQQIAGFGQTGKVTEIDPATLAYQSFRDSKIYLLTEVGYEKNDQPKTSIIYLVKNFNGNLFAITLFMPLKEAAEGITPSLWAMLDTLEAQ